MIKVNLEFYPSSNGMFTLKVIYSVDGKLFEKSYGYRYDQFMTESLNSLIFERLQAEFNNCLREHFNNNFKDVL